MRIVRTSGLFFIATAFSVLGARGQAIVKPTPIIDTLPPAIHAVLKGKLDRENSSIDAEKAKVRSFVKTLQTKRYEHVVKLFNDDKIIVSSPLNIYLNNIVANVCKANPEIPKDVAVYIERNTIANATSYGEGTIIVSLALLLRLENEQQVAFVMCHELAHYYLNHTKEAIYRFADLNFDKELNREARGIRNDRYGNYTRMREFMKGIELNENRHSRSKEFEADEMGLKFLLNSQYADTAAPVRTMHILDSVDHEQYRYNLDLAKHFDFKNFPFKSSWTTYNREDIWQVSQYDSDTTRTHPSCIRRAAALSRQLAPLQLQDAYVASIPYETIRRQAAVDLIQSSYHLKKYGRALFDALVFAEQYPENAWLRATIGRCLYQLYVAQAAHQLSKSLDQPSSRNDENYDRFLKFMHQLRLSELENITYNYIVNQKEEYFNDEEFLYTVWLVSHLKVSQLSPLAVEEDYHTKFPNGRYKSLIK
jgi:Peptidase family M48